MATQPFTSLSEWIECDQVRCPSAGQTLELRKEELCGFYILDTVNIKQSKFERSLCLAKAFLITPVNLSFPTVRG